MGTPPWIRSAIDTGLAAARLEAQASGPAAPTDQKAEFRHAQHSTETDDRETESRHVDDGRDEGAATEGPVDVPLELELEPRSEAAFVATLRERARGTSTRKAGRDDAGERAVAESFDREEPDPRSRIGAGPLKTTAALVGLVACIVGGFTLGGGFDGAGTAEVPEVADVDAQSAHVPLVESEEGGETEYGENFFRGDGPGDRLSQVGVVAAFEYAYYVEKDPIRAVELTAEDAGLDPIRLDAEGIGVLPEGTTHCLEAHSIGDDVVSVRLSELRPDTEPIVIHQRIRTGLDDDGIYEITEIEHTEDPAQ